MEFCNLLVNYHESLVSISHVDPRISWWSLSIWPSWYNIKPTIVGDDKKYPHIHITNAKVVIFSLLLPSKYQRHWSMSGIRTPPDLKIGTPYPQFFWGKLCLKKMQLNAFLHPVAPHKRWDYPRLSPKIDPIRIYDVWWHWDKNCHCFYNAHQIQNDYTFNFQLDQQCNALLLLDDLNVWHFF